MTKISHTVKVYFQALKAKKTIVLAQEPDGDRYGLVGEQYAATPLTVTAFGDSMAAACGTSGLPPMQRERAPVRRFPRRRNGPPRK